ncbi:SIS domain-containing protein [Paenibacillus sp. 481]|uniref:SIS domain-containing protein n=1 Tax=Paenibacillus sp. 481 TaxID=2835869 RepID=UPI001E5F314B|nr:SIS domain-containing protein [Paenibacillus sp. 481]UHA71792.1 SIS domain-containing protein [Paenibacillus sp. 481]
MSNKEMQTYKEISDQSEALQQAWDELYRQLAWVQRYIGNDQFDEVVFIGSGSSWYQALTMAATYRKWTGRSASAHPSSDLFLFRDQTVTAAKKTLLVCVSRSGQSHEVIFALESVQHLPQWVTCGITCYPDSRMANMTECLISPFGAEQSTVMTKSFSSMTFMMQAAIALGAGKERELEQLAVVLHAHASFVKMADQAAQEWVEAHHFHKTIYLGMGACYGLALEACLKLKEMTYTWTEAFGTLEFRHGPKSIVEQGTQVVLLLSEQARSYELKVAQEMKQFGATVVILTAYAGEDTKFADNVITLGELNSTVSDEARAVLYLPFVQYIGYYSAIKYSLNPDEPRNLTQFVSI